MNMKKTLMVFALAVMAPLLTASFCRAMPKITRLQLPNHLKLLVFEDHSIPAVTLEMLVAAGASLDPSSLEGLANLTANSLSLGTRSLSFDQINNKLDFMGATYGVDCTKDFVTIDMQVLKKDLAAGVSLFTEIVEHPSFPDDDLSLQKDEIIGQVQEDEDNPLKIADRAFDKALFRDSPYAGSVQGDKKSVLAITRVNLSKFYDSYYRPNNAVLVIGGDITPGEVKAKIIPKLIGWNPGRIPKSAFKTPAGKNSAKVLIDKPISQAAIIIGCSVMARSGTDYYPFLVLNQILGAGDLSSRLMTDIRTKSGLAYRVQSRLAAYKHAGSFQVVLQTKNASAEQAMAQVQQELESLMHKPVSEEELKAAKQFLTGNFPLRYSMPGNFAKFLAEAEFYGLGPDYMQKYPALIDAVTAGDIQRVAMKYLATHCAVVIVGNIAKIKRSDFSGPALPALEKPAPGPVQKPPAAGPPKPSGK
jgi:zinc protease